MVAKVQISYIEAVITCPNCGKPRDSQLPGKEHAIDAGYEFRCVACGTVYEIRIVRPIRATELRNEAESGTCPSCDGTGVFTIGEKSWQCNACNGSGHV